VVTLGALYQTRTKTDVIAEASEESPSLVAYSITSPEVGDIVPLAPQFATRVERKPLATSGSKAKIIAGNSRASIPIPLPVRSNSTQAFFENFDEGYLGGGWGDGDGEGSGGGLRQMPIQGRGGNKYGALIERGFLTPIKAPLSTFSIDVDTASYTNIRRHIEDRNVIDPDAVRIEEMINYFDYQYAEPAQGHPFAVHAEVANCPWNTRHRLVKIGLKGKEVHEDRKAANLVFLIDVSGSMKSPDKLPLLVKSFEILVKSLNENDKVSLVVYAGRQAVLLKPTSLDKDGRQSVSRALQKLTAGGATNGAAGISTAYDLARSGFIEGGVNRVFLATDGDFNVGTANNDELLKLVKNQAEGKIPLTILGQAFRTIQDGIISYLQVTYYQLFRTIRRVEN
jgi:Mg-chelatase subunit ChlD